MENPIEDKKKAERMAYAEKPLRDLATEKNLSPEQRKFIEKRANEVGEKVGEKYDELGREKYEEEEKKLNWFEATRLSPCRKAFRKTKEGKLIVMDEQGIATYPEIPNKFPLTEEYESFYDWKPLEKEILKKPKVEKAER